MDQIFEHETISIDEALAASPKACGVLALFGAQGDKPYLAKTTNLHRRFARLLQPAEGQTARIALRDRIAKIAWRITGSDFESNLVLYRAYAEYFSLDEARKRLKLRAPYFIRFAAENRFPRLYVTNKLTRRALKHTYGPFASRAAAERYLDGVHELFKLRRCHEELRPAHDHPGCVYGEMKKCNAPCQLRVSDEEYGAEAKAVADFLNTRGESLLTTIATERDRASEAMEFEAAAAAHARYTEVKATAESAGEIVRPVSELRAVLLLPSARDATTVEAWLLHGGCLRGPKRFSTLGIRIAKEQSQVGSSLFAQPLMLQPVALDEAVSTETPEERLLALLTQLEDGTPPTANLDEVADHLALLKRWYYRPEIKRIGTICFPENGSWPVRKLVRAAAKVSMKAGAGAISPTWQSEAATPQPDTDDAAVTDKLSS
ncbi:MAG: excinuclease ABC subunit C [Acidobacteria bacterium]|nr:excinuclease ABC subunit C [Acidobacteriota bacterium]